MVGMLWLMPLTLVTELAHSFLLCSFVCFCFYGPLNSISIHKFSRQLSIFSFCSSGCISVILALSTIFLHTSLSLYIYISLYQSICLSIYLYKSLLQLWVPTGSPSRGGHDAVYVRDINQPSLPTPFNLFCSCVCFCLSTVFHSINSPLSHSVLPCLISASLVLSTLYFFMKASFSPDMTLCG